MRKNLLFGASLFLALSLLLTSCTKEEVVTDPTQTNTTPTNNTNNTDNSNTTTKPTATTFKFAANGIDCGLTDGYSNQSRQVQIIHLNTDKCNGDVYRPTISLYFQIGKPITPGTYTIVTATNNPGINEVSVTSAKYNFTDWSGTSGTVIVTQNSEDNTKLDIELKSITMKNQDNNDTKNPSTDVLTGYIIKV